MDERDTCESPPGSPFAAVERNQEVVRHWRMLWREDAEQATSEKSSWFLVSKRWFADFEEFADATEAECSKELGNQQGAHQIAGPGPINNTSLIDTSSAPSESVLAESGRHWNACLRPDLSTAEFVAVSEGAWNFLSDAFGGGPAIAVWAVRDAAGNVALEPRERIKVGLRRRGETVNELVFYISRAMPLRLFRQSVFRALYIYVEDDRPSDYTLYDWINGPARDLDASADEQDPALSVADAGIQAASHLVFVSRSDPEGSLLPPSLPHDAGRALNGSLRINPRGPAFPQRPAPCMAMGDAPGSVPAPSPLVNGYGAMRMLSSSGASTSALADLNTDSETPDLGRSPGLAGLWNLGNTCYMNSALQCLAHAVPLVRAFLSGAYLADLNEANPLGSKGAIARAFGSLLARLWRGSVGSVAPRGFRRAIRGSLFDDSDQHDSQEFMLYLLDMLAEDLNRVREKPATAPVDAKGRSDELVAKEAWDVHKLRHDSVVVDAFHGLEKETVLCTACRAATVKFQPLMYLTLAIPVSLPRDFTLVPVDGSRAPMVCAVRVGRSVTVGAFLASAAEVVGIACGDVPARLCAALWNPLHERVTALDDPAAPLPAKGMEVLVVYLYPTMEQGPRGGGLCTVILPPSTTGYLKPLPLVLWPRPEDIVLEDECSSQPGLLARCSRGRLVAKRDCAMVGHVDDALRPFKRARRASADGTVATGGAPTPAAAAAATSTLTPQIGGVCVGDVAECDVSMGGARSGSEACSEGGESTIALPGDCSDDTGMQGVEVGVSGSGVVSVDCVALPIEPEGHSGAEDTEGALPLQRDAAARCAGVPLSMARGLRGYTRSDDEQDGVAMDASVAGSGSDADGGSDDDAAPWREVDGGDSDAAGSRAGGSVGGDVAVAGPRASLPGGHRGAGAAGAPALSPGNGSWLSGPASTVPPPQSFPAFAAHGAGTRREDGAVCCADPEAAPLAGAPGTPTFRLVAVTETNAVLLIEPESPPCRFRLELPPGVDAARLFDLDAMARPQRHASAELIHERRSHTLEACLKGYMATEELDAQNRWKCPACSQDVQARRSHAIWALPEILVIYLKRFIHHTPTSYQKLTDLVHFPLEGLDMSDYVISPDRVDAVYDCFAVSNHYGTTLGGHCTAFCRQTMGCAAAAPVARGAAGTAHVGPAAQPWYEFDDCVVRQVPAEQVVAPACYVLFYRRRSAAMQDPPDLLEQLQRECMRNISADAGADAGVEGVTCPVRPASAPGAAAAPSPLAHNAAEACELGSAALQTGRLSSLAGEAFVVGPPGGEAHGGFLSGIGAPPASPELAMVAQPTPRASPEVSGELEEGDDATMPDLEAPPRPAMAQSELPGAACKGVMPGHELLGHSGDAGGSLVALGQGGASGRECTGGSHS